MKQTWAQATAYMKERCIRKVTSYPLPTYVRIVTVQLVKLCVPSRSVFLPQGTVLLSNIHRGLAAQPNMTAVMNLPSLVTYFSFLIILWYDLMIPLSRHIMTYCLMFQNWYLRIKFPQLMFLLTLKQMNETPLLSPQQHLQAVPRWSQPRTQLLRLWV